MDKQQNKIRYGDVDITKPHFFICWKNNLLSDNYRAIMVLSMAYNVQEMKMFLLEHDVKYLNAIRDVENEIYFYLKEINKKDPISYLIYHCGTMANIYSNTNFQLVNKIVKKNILYYILTRSKQICIYDKYLVEDIVMNVVNCKISNMIKPNKQSSDIVMLNKYFNYLIDIINYKLPANGNFVLDEIFTIFEFSKFLANISIYQFANMINYLKKVKLIKKHNDIIEFIRVYNYAKIECQTINSTT